MGEDGSMEADSDSGTFAADLVSTSVEATLAWAAAIGRALWPGSVIALNGDLGAGKTTFVRGLCDGLEVTDPVHSPSYTLMHTYPGRLEVFHFDAWMEGREAAFLDGGGAEWLHGDGVAVVEWASRIGEYLPERRLEIELLHLKAPEIDDDGHPVGEPVRGIRVRALGAMYIGLAQDLTSLKTLPKGLVGGQEADSWPWPFTKESNQENSKVVNPDSDGPLRAPDRLI
jgi:tRNA threonylcarbamoyladenosine biosynthesis protein TsaE